MLREEVTGMVELPSSSVLNMTIPITRFNKGEANKVFDEVRQSGFKVVLKNNAPACVLLSPAKYKEMIDELEDSRLYALAAERLENDNGITYPADEVYGELSLNSADIDKIPVEHGVDFE